MGHRGDLRGSAPHPGGPPQARPALVPGKPPAPLAHLRPQAAADCPHPPFHGNYGVSGQPAVVPIPDHGHVACMGFQDERSQLAAVRRFRGEVVRDRRADAGAGVDGAGFHTPFPTKDPRPVGRAAGTESQAFLRRCVCAARGDFSRNAALHPPRTLRDDGAHADGGRYHFWAGGRMGKSKP